MGSKTIEISSIDSSMDLLPLNDYQWRYVMTPEERMLASEMGLRHYHKPKWYERVLGYLYQILP